MIIPPVDKKCWTLLFCQVVKSVECGEELIGQFDHRTYLSALMKIGLERERFGDIEDITDKCYYMGSFHTDFRENINLFDKLKM